MINNRQKRTFLYLHTYSVVRVQQFYSHTITVTVRTNSNRQETKPKKPPEIPSINIEKKNKTWQ